MARRGDGLYLRSRTWWLDFRHDGTRHTVRIGKDISRSIAKDIARVKRGEILTAESGIGGKKRKDPTFGEASKLFLEWVKANTRLNTQKFYSDRLESLGSSFKTTDRLSRISTFNVEAHKQKLAREEKKVSANREVAALKALFNRMRSLKKYDGPNPVVGVKLFGEVKDEEEARFFSPEEEERLLAVAGEPLRTMILMGIYAGLRITAILTLRWENVTLREWRNGEEHSFLKVLGAHSKNKKFRIVPVNSKLLGVLEQHRDRSVRRELEDYVFNNRNGGHYPYPTINRHFIKARNRAGIAKDVTFHSTRHTFASRLVMAGVDLRTVQILGGWRNLKMLERYAHLTPDHKEMAVERLVGGDLAENSQRFSQHQKLGTR